MHYFWTALFACIALVWIVQGARAVRGMRQLPHLADVESSPATDCPHVSVIFAARDEAEKLPAALESLLGQDYPDYEVIAADDRSEDATGQILDEFARQHHRLRVVHVAELPEGWLGKPHGLYRSILALSVLHFLGVVFARGLSRVFAGIAAVGAIAIHTWCTRNYRIGWYYGLTHPLGGLIFCYMLVRSTVVTLWRGGVVWRGTFYPLEQLKRGLVR